MKAAAGTPEQDSQIESMTSQPLPNLRVGQPDTGRYRLGCAGEAFAARKWIGPVEV